jgi:adenine deaminase
MEETIMSSTGEATNLGRFELTRVALGQSEANLAIVNAEIVNVYTGELLKGDCVLIKGDRIAYCGPYARRGIGPKTQIIDASSRTLIPGFIDGHTHMDYLYTSYELARFALRSGTTTIITEVAEIAFRLGYRGILDYLKSTRHQPIKFWFTLPPMGTLSPIAAKYSLTTKEARRLLRRSDCVGLGETYWGAVNAGDPRLLEMIAETLKAGKKVEGHSAGATANKLQAYTALGVSSDHEPISSQETLERLRLGLSVMIREGEVRQDLAGVSAIKDHQIDFRRLAISTDGVGPLQFITEGFMEHVIQKAVDLGFPPLQSIQMGTLNVAEHFNLQDQIGGIAPGRFADILIIPSVEVIKPETVISSGRVVFQNGESVVDPRRHHYPSSMYCAIRLKKKFEAADFYVKTAVDNTHRKVRIIDQVSNILTRESILELPASGDQIICDITQDVIKVTAVEYLHTGGQSFTGFIRGLGLNRGAIATSSCWDSCNIAVAGASETDMALAVNRIKDLGGGCLACMNGQILAEVPFPIASLISEEPMEKLARQLTDFQQAATILGCRWPDVRTTLSVLLTPAIPYLRICEAGIFNVKHNALVDLLVEE